MNDDTIKLDIINFSEKVIYDKWIEDNKVANTGSNKEKNYLKDSMSLGIPNEITAGLIRSRFHEVSEFELKQIGLSVKALNFSVEDFDIILTADAVRHIDRKHGKRGKIESLESHDYVKYRKKGKSDQSMGDTRSYGLIYEVLQSPNNIEVSRDENDETVDLLNETEDLVLNIDTAYPSSYGDGKCSVKLKYTKIIDGYYFFVIVIVHKSIKNKQLIIKTAYRKKIK